MQWPGGLDDMLTHVPLMIRVPGGKANHTVAEPVQLFGIHCGFVVSDDFIPDLLPTILELANITLNHTQFGVSLVPQLFGSEGDPNRTVYSEGGFYWYVVSLVWLVWK